MPRIQSARSDMSDADADGYAEREQELQRLQRQLRIMENDRKAYSLESQDKIKRQRSEMEKLEAERAETLKDLRLIESRSNQTRDEHHIEDLGELGREKTSIEDEIKGEKNRQQELDADIREWTKKIRDYNKTRGGANSSAQHNMATKKKGSKLESQLQLANNSFCQALEVNKQLREEIDNLRVERARFEQLHGKLEKELKQLREEIGQVIEQSTRAYDNREEAQARMISLREKADKDLQQHNAEMKELVRIIDHDRKLRDFMNTKSKDRPEDSQLVAWREAKEQLEAEKKKASQTDSVESYEEAFERIKLMSGEEDLDLLVKHFIEVEDKNFALFSLVNEQNDNLDLLQEHINQIKGDIDEFQNQQIDLEAQRARILKQMETKQDQVIKDKESNDDVHAGNMKIIDQLRAGTESLFGKINCDSTAIDDLLGAQTGVTSQNMIQYLGVVEERTNQLLLIQSYLLTKQDSDDYQKKPANLLGEGPTAAGPVYPNITPPTVGDDLGSDDEDSDEDAPLSVDQLRARAQKAVKKREAAAKKQGHHYDLSEPPTKKGGRGKVK